MPRLILAAAPFEVEDDLLPFLKCVGIGPVRSAIEAASLPNIESQDVLFVGSCGVFSDFKAPTLFGISEVQWSDLGMRLDLSYSVAMPAIKLDPPVGLESRIALCSGSVARDNRLPINMSKDHYVENLELYSVASALIPRARSFQAILCSTNLTGPNSHEQWKANHKEAARICSAFIRTEI
jgi:hypothetical protein